MLQAKQPLRCTYHTLESGIHQITMYESSQQAVDDWLYYMGELFHAAPYDYLPVLLDLREPGMMPVGYATHRVKQWSKTHRVLPFMDLAVVYRYGLLYPLASALVELSSIPDGIRLFHNGRYDDARVWLYRRVTQS